MKLVRDWDVNYNGGVIRFTPMGETEQVVIWQTSNLTVQQHSESATFSAPATDGRQAWLNISRDGQINGGGIHGTTLESYVRCGDARNGVESVGPTTVSLDCRFGLGLDDDGNPDPSAPRQYQYETWQVTYDFSEYPFKSFINQSRPEWSIPALTTSSVVVRNIEFDGKEADFYFPTGTSTTFSFVAINEKVIGFSKSGRFTFVEDWHCGDF